MQKMLFRFVAFLSVGLSLLGIQSCKEFEPIYIQVLMPAEKILPDNLHSFTIMNHSMNDSFLNYSTDSLQRAFLKKGFNTPLTVCDSVVSDTTIKVLADALYNTEFFDVVVPNNRNIKRQEPIHTNSAPLSWNFVQNICDTYKTDGLIVLEKYVPKIKGKFTNSRVLGNMSEPIEYYMDLDITFDVLWRIYNPATQTISDEYTVKDTIFTENSTFSNRMSDIYDIIPYAKQSLISASSWLAKDFTQRISPEWVTERRGIFVGNNSLKTALQFVNNHEWEKAETCWIELTKQPNRMLKSKAEFNMALACEIKGDLNGAFKWATESYKTYYRIQTEDYLMTLKKRIETVGNIETKATL